jgi:hypothetical protein
MDNSPVHDEATSDDSARSTDQSPAAAKRPTSVRIATIISGMAVLGILAFAVFLFNAHPTDRAPFLTAFKHPIYAWRLTLCSVCFPVLVFKPRALFTFYATATFLALLTISCLESALGAAPTPPFRAASLPLAWLMTLLIGLLFWRFAFGRPSRAFFRLIADEQ